jgi:hypothetical protein
MIRHLLHREAKLALDGEVTPSHGEKSKGTLSQMTYCCDLTFHYQEIYSRQHRGGLQ